MIANHDQRDSMLSKSSNAKTESFFESSSSSASSHTSHEEEEEVFPSRVVQFLPEEQEQIVLLVLYTEKGRLICLQWPRMEIMWETRLLPTGWTHCTNVITADTSTASNSDTERYRDGTAAPAAQSAPLQRCGGWSASPPVPLAPRTLSGDTAQRTRIFTTARSQWSPYSWWHVVDQKHLGRPLPNGSAETTKGEVQNEHSTIREGCMDNVESLFTTAFMPVDDVWRVALPPFLALSGKRFAAPLERSQEVYIALDTNSGMAVHTPSPPCSLLEPQLLAIQAAPCNGAIPPLALLPKGVNVQLGLIFAVKETHVVLPSATPACSWCWRSCALQRVCPTVHVLQHEERRRRRTPYTHRQSYQQTPISTTTSTSCSSEGSESSSGSDEEAGGRHTPYDTDIPMRSRSGCHTRSDAVFSKPLSYIAESIWCAPLGVHNHVPTNSGHDDKGEQEVLHSVNTNDDGCFASKRMSTAAGKHFTSWWALPQPNEEETDAITQAFVFRISICSGIHTAAAPRVRWDIHTLPVLVEAPPGFSLQDREGHEVPAVEKAQGESWNGCPCTAIRLKLEQQKILRQGKHPKSTIRVGSTRCEIARQINGWCLPLMGCSFYLPDRGGRGAAPHGETVTSCRTACSLMFLSSPIGDWTQQGQAKASSSHISRGCHSHAATKTPQGTSSDTPRQSSGTVVVPRWSANPSRSGSAMRQRQHYYSNSSSLSTSYCPRIFTPSLDVTERRRSHSANSYCSPNSQVMALSTATHPSTQFPNSGASLTSPVRSSAMASQPSSQYSFFEVNFEPLRLLGRGAYGAALLVRHRMSGKLYAVKILLVQDYASERDVLQEVRVHASLDCRYLVQYHSSWSEVVTPERSEQLESIGLTHRRRASRKHRHLSHADKAARQQQDASSRRDSNEKDPSGRSSPNNLSSTLKRKVHDPQSPASPAPRPTTSTNNTWSFLLEDHDDDNVQLVGDEEFSSSSSVFSSSTASSTSWLEKASRENEEGSSEMQDEDGVDALTDMRVVFIQMQLCQLTLAELLSVRKSIDRIENLVILLQLCSGLLYLHDRGILHRDVKPTNIFLDFSCRFSSNAGSLSDDDVNDDKEFDLSPRGDNVSETSDGNVFLHSKPTAVDLSTAAFYGAGTFPEFSESPVRNRARGERSSVKTDGLFCTSLTCVPSYVDPLLFVGSPLSASSLFSPASLSQRHSLSLSNFPPPWFDTAAPPCGFSNVCPSPSREEVSMLLRRMREAPHEDTCTFIRLRSDELLKKWQYSIREFESLGVHSMHHHGSRLLATWLLRHLVHARLGDFGLAKLNGQQKPKFHSGGKVFSMADANTHGVGSPLYASPEQLRGDVCTAASDLYSVAILMVEMYLLPTTIAERLDVLQKTRDGRYPTAAAIEEFPELSVVPHLTLANPMSRMSLRALRKYLFGMLHKCLRDELESYVRMKKM